VLEDHARYYLLLFRRSIGCTDGNILPIAGMKGPL
jgi:hypothetical protein